MALTLNEAPPMGEGRPPCGLGYIALRLLSTLLRVVDLSVRTAFSKSDSERVGPQLGQCVRVSAAGRCLPVSLAGSKAGSVTYAGNYTRSRGEVGICGLI